MTEKLAAFFRRFPRLSRRQRLARNLLIVLVLILAVSLWDLQFPDSTGLAALFPRSWRFRLEERRCLLAPSELVADLSMEDAIHWDAEAPNLFNREDWRNTARWSFGETYGKDRFLLGCRGDWLHVYSSDTGWIYVLPRQEDAAVFLNSGSTVNEVRETMALLAYTDLPGAAAVEAELEIWSEQDGTVTRLAGSGALENGAALLVLERQEDPSPTEPDPDRAQFTLRLTVRDGAGNALCGRDGAVEYYGGWTDEN